MGFWSKIYRYHGAGQDPNAYNVGEYGEPVHSLYSELKMLTLHQHTDITDEAGQVLYQARSKMVSLHDKTDIVDASGRHVAHIEAKLLSFHERHYITMADGRRLTLSNEFFHLIRDITNIEELGWQIRGNLLELNFALIDGDGLPVAAIAQKMVSFHDRYCIDIYQPEQEEMVVAIVITLQHMIRKREEQRANSGSAE